MSTRIKNKLKLLGCLKASRISKILVTICPILFLKTDAMMIKHYQLIRSRILSMYQRHGYFFMKLQWETKVLKVTYSTATHLV